MSMSKKDFIALADEIREHNRVAENALIHTGVPGITPFRSEHLAMLAAFCKSQNPAFMRDRWLGYIAGTNGKNGGAK
jgi:hypothetical protein